MVVQKGFPVILRFHYAHGIALPIVSKFPYDIYLSAFQIRMLQSIRSKIWMAGVFAPSLRLCCVPGLFTRCWREQTHNERVHRPATKSRWIVDPRSGGTYGKKDEQKSVNNISRFRRIARDKQILFFKIFVELPKRAYACVLFSCLLILLCDYSRRMVVAEIRSGGGGDGGNDSSHSLSFRSILIPL